jgi:hypothetical protein
MKVFGLATSFACAECGNHLEPEVPWKASHVLMKEKVTAHCTYVGCALYRKSVRFMMPHMEISAELVKP